MSSGGASPGGVPSPRSVDEVDSTVLFDSERTRVRLVVRTDGTRVVFKEARGRGAASRIRHETSLLDRLARVPGVPKLVPFSHPPHAGDGGSHRAVPGGHLGRPRPAGRDRGDRPRPAARRAPPGVHASRGDPRPAPLSGPRAGGRTGLAVDVRTDLYGLGAVLYEAVSTSRSLTSDTIDMIAFSRAAKALASQTTMARLHETLVEQLRAITGATWVHLVLREQGARQWQIVGAFAEPGSSTGLDEPAAGHLVPVSAVRYTVRTGRPLLVVPVAHAVDLRAVLVLENRLTSGAFTIAWLDSVTMLTGQLATALENARLYASLQERIALRTEQLQAASSQLEQLAVTDALIGVANRRHFDERLSPNGTWRSGRAVHSRSS